MNQARRSRIHVGSWCIIKEVYELFVFLINSARSCLFIAPKPPSVRIVPTNLIMSQCARRATLSLGRGQGEGDRDARQSARLHGNERYVRTPIRFDVLWKARQRPIISAFCFSAARGHTVQNLPNRTARR
jgi:hypothetical protein